MRVDAPHELAARPQWVAWRLVPRPGETKPTKVPINARTGQNASTTDPATWATFDEACTFEPSDGVGYVLSEGDPYVGVDLDECRDPISGTIEVWAKAIIRRLSSYTEISPSGTGLRIFVVGELPPHGRRKGHIEVYCKARFLTITGDRYMAASGTINERRAELLAWHREVFGDGPAARQNGHTAVVARRPTELADAELLEKAQQATNGATFRALWNGDYSAYPSQSEADLALANFLAFWVGPDESRIYDLIRLSGMFREKWERADYRAWTIGKALDGRTDYYDPHWRSSSVQFGVGVIGARIDLGNSPWKDIKELTMAKAEETRQLVQHLIWEGLTHWWYSGPGAGKTLTGLALLLHMAAGKAFHGLEVVQGAAVIIEEDSSDAVIADYVRMLADIYEIELEGLPIYFNRQRGLRLRDQAGLDYMLELVDRAPNKPAVCLVDACERLVPSENFNSNELDYLSRFFAANVANGITNIMIDHTRKTQPSGGDKIDLIEMLYGGRTKSAISDVLMYFSGAIKNRAMLQFPKFRGVEPSPVQLSFDGASGFTVKAGAPKLAESERQVMMAINNAFGKPLSREQIEATANLTTRTAQRALNKLIDLGWVTRVGDNRDAQYLASAVAGGLFS